MMDAGRRGWVGSDARGPLFLHGKFGVGVNVSIGRLQVGRSGSRPAKKCLGGWLFSCPWVYPLFAAEEL